MGRGLFAAGSEPEHRRPRRGSVASMTRPIHLLTITPFYPSENDDASGCFVAEPLNALARAGVLNTVFAVQPFYRAKLRAAAPSGAVQWLRYPSIPGRFGLSTAGAFLFARCVSAVRALHRENRIDLIHAHAA